MKNSYVNRDKWLQLLLKERFGILFNFSREIDTTLVLTIDSNSTKSIVFTNVDPTFYDSNLVENMKCDAWNARQENFEMKLDDILPMPFHQEVRKPVIEYVEDKCLIHYDILGLTYWMLARVEEFRNVPLDSHGRFSAKQSHAYKYGYLERPIVDEWLDIFKQVLVHLFPNIQLKQHEFKQYISHDVDRPSKFGFATLPKLIRGLGGDLLREKNILSIFTAPYIRLTSSKKISHLDPYNSFSWIMDVVEENNLKTSFYFICGGVHRLDADYSMQSLPIHDLLKNISNRGHEIGLHPSYETYLNPSQLYKEFMELKNTCNSLGIQQNEWGGRMHYLRWQQDVTMNAWDNAGLSYDSTLAYADQVGFRCGTCYEYTAFNHQLDKILNLRIRPLIVMEATVFYYEKYGITDLAYDRMNEMKIKCKLMQGQFSLLWHNNEFVRPKAKEIFSSLLKT